MAQFNFWNQFNLYWTKIIPLFFLVVFSTSVQAQNGKTTNLANHDDQKLHFGFYLALNSNGTRVVQSDYFVQSKIQDTLRAIHAPWAGGANVGFVLNFRIADYVDFRVLPGFTFTERTLNYEFLTLGQKYETKKLLEYTYVEIPACFKFKSARRGNHRVYFLAGGKMSIATNIKKKNPTPEQVRLYNYGYAIEYGAGIDIYNMMFKLAPEIRISHGINNMIIPDQYIFTKSVSKLFLHTVTLVFNFE